MWLTTWSRARTAVYEVNYEFKLKLKFRGYLDLDFLRSRAMQEFTSQNPRVRFQNLTFLRVED